MDSLETNQDVVDVIRSELAKLNWELISIGATIATKAYQGINHQHEAQTLLIPGSSSGSTRFILCGTFISEGRNILESLSTTIEESWTKDKIAEVVRAYAEDADARISQSYSVGLYLRWGATP